MRKEITDVQLIDDIDGSPATTTIVARYHHHRVRCGRQELHHRSL